MDVKVLFKKSRKFYALILLLLIFTVPVALSGCGGGGGGSSSGASASINPNGTVSTSQTYNISGTVAGGSGNLSGVTVALYVLNTANDSFSSTGDTTTTGNNGSYSLTYTGSGLDYFLVVVVTPSGNTLYNIAFGSLGVPNITMNIDELTTAQAVYAFQQAGGTMTPSGNGIPLGSISNYSQLYNDLPTSPSNTYAVGFSHASVSSNLPSTAASEIETLADALASCVQSTSYCSSVKGNLPNYTSGDGMFIYILIGNYTNANMQTVLNNLISAISSLNVPWTSPTPTSSSSTTTTSPTTTITYNTYAAGSYPINLAIDSSGNVWVADDGGNVTELNSSGDIIGTYFTGGNDLRGIAIDSSGNVWVASNGNGTVGNAPGDSNIIELNSSGKVIGTYLAGTYPSGIAIDPSGNIWVANQGAIGGIVGTAIGDSNVMKLNSSGNLIGTYDAGIDPYGIAIDSSDNVWITSINSDIIELNSSGSTIGTYPVSTGQYAIAIDSLGNVWIPGDNGDVIELNSSGSTIGTYPAYSAGITQFAIAIDSAGNVWIANYGDGTIGTAPGDSNVIELNPSGKIIGTYLAGSYPDGIAIDGSGNVWVANYGSNSVTELVGVASGVKIPLVLQPK